MLILALDTTTKAGSGALLRDREILGELISDPSQPPASRLPADLMALLADTGVALADVDVFAVATGPGSFTGLRVGIATMQGLAFAAGKPLIGVSAFDALASLAAMAPASPPRIAAWVDAWRGEVFAALYDQGAEIEPPLVEHPEALLSRLLVRLSSPSRRVPTIFIGNAAATYADLIRDRLGDAAIIASPASPPLASTIATLAFAEAVAGHRPPPDAIRPLYVRRPESELARDVRPVS